jgi:uncharacterized protein (TIGR04255 family)
MIPNYECEHLRNSPIALVVAQVRFSPLSNFQDSSRLAPFFDGVLSDYPHHANAKSQSILIDDKGSVRSQEGEATHRFTSSDFLWSVTLGSESMSLECSRNGYRDIADFSNRFNRIALLLAQLAPKKQLRFGFRFVNEMRVEGGGAYAYWRSALNPAVLGYDAAAEFGGPILSTISEVNVQRDDGTLRVRRGFLPSGTTVPPLVTPRGPTIPASGPFYLIDLDYFSDAVVDFSPAFQPRLHDYNTFMYRVFHWIVGEGDLWSGLKGIAS